MRQSITYRLILLLIFFVETLIQIGQNAAAAASLALDAVVVEFMTEAVTPRSVKCRCEIHHHFGGISSSLDGSSCKSSRFAPRMNEHFRIRVVFRTE